MTKQFGFFQLLFCAPKNCQQTANFYSLNKTATRGTCIIKCIFQSCLYGTRITPQPTKLPPHLHIRAALSPHITHVSSQYTLVGSLSHVSLITMCIYSSTPPPFSPHALFITADTLNAYSLIRDTTRRLPAANTYLPTYLPTNQPSCISIVCM